LNLYFNEQFVLNEAYQSLEFNYWFYNYIGFRRKKIIIKLMIVHKLSNLMSLI